MTGHQANFQNNWEGIYLYDEAEDGPECEAITRILAKHPLYKPGQEKHDLVLWRILNRGALILFKQSYDSLREDMREVVIKRVAAGFVVRGQA